MNNFRLFTILILFLPFYINAFPLPLNKISSSLEHELPNLSIMMIANDSLNTITFESMTANVSDSLHEKTPEKKSFTLLMTYSVAACVCMLINVRAFYIVYIASKRKSRPANVLVAHLSVVIIAFTFLCYTYVLEKGGALNLSAPGICSVVMYLRKVFYNVLSVNTVAIIWVRITDDAVILRKSVAYRVIGVTWVITLVSNLPTIWMAEYASSSKTKRMECTEMNLFGSVAATIVYDIYRLLLFNVLVSLYLILAAIKIRSVLRFLNKYKLVHSKTMRGRIKQARLVYFQTTLFIVNWLPLGFGVLLYRIFNRSGWNDTYINYLTPLVILYSNVIIFSPMSYVCLIEKMSIAEILAPCLRPKSRHNLPTNLATSGQDGQAAPEGSLNRKLKRKAVIGRPNTSATSPTGDGIINKIPDEIFLTSEMSRFSSVGITEFPGSENNSMANMRPLPRSFFAQCSSTAARSTQATSIPMQDVRVEVQSEPNQPDNEDETVPHKSDSETLV